MNTEADFRSQEAAYEQYERAYCYHRDNASAVTLDAWHFITNDEAESILARAMNAEVYDPEPEELS